MVMDGSEETVMLRVISKIFVPLACVFTCAIATIAAFGSLAAHAQGTDDWQAGAGENWRQVLAAARKEGKVVVTGVAPLSPTISANFERDTGIPVEFVIGSPSDITTRLQREAKAGSVMVDVALNGGAEFSTMYMPGYLQPIAPKLMLPGVTNPANFIGGKIKWFDNKQAYMMQVSNWVHAWVVINSNVIDISKIHNWSDLLKPEYKGKIAAYDPRLGGPGQSAGSYLTHQFGIDFVKRLYSGQEVTYTRDNRQLVEWAARGTYPIVLGAIQSEVDRFQKSGMKQLVVPTLADGPGTMIGGYSVVTMPKGIPHPNAATVFVNWMASRPGQITYASTMLESSTRVDSQIDAVPDYVRPKPGLKYTLDQYTEDWYKNERPKIAQALVDVLGGR
jgi:ABC-type Fe3+ transport system substrate-binding protein